jgi:iron(III) transport system permease protein
MSAHADTAALPAATAVRRRRRLPRRLGLAAPLLLVLFVLVMLPVGFMFVGAVRSGGLADPTAHFTLAELRTVYATERYLRTLASTLVVSVIVSVLANVAGVKLAWLVARTDLPARSILEGCIIAPLFLSPFVGALAWLILGSPKAGLLNAFAHGLFGMQGPLIDVATPLGIVLITALYFVPYAYLSVAAALQSVDPSMEEASYLNGAGMMQTALRITMPVIRPALVSSFFFIFVLSAGTFAIPAVLDRGSQLRLLALDVFQASSTYPIDYGRAAAIGTVLFWVSVIGIACYRFSSRAAQRFVTVTARGYRIRRIRLRAWRWPAACVVVAYLVLAIVLPYLALVYAAFTSFVSADVLHAPYTWQNAAGVAASPEVVSSILNTLFVGLVSPTLCVALGVLLAYAIRRLRIAGGAAMDFMALFPLAVPAIVFGTGVFWTYILTPVYGTDWVLVLAFVASYLPFAYRMSDTSLLQIDRALEEASALCGAPHLRTALRVTLPLIRPALLSAWLMTFIFSVREISAAILLTSSDNTMLSVLSWNYLDYGDVQKAAVVGLIQTAILAAGMLAGRYVFRVRLARAM